MSINTQVSPNKILTDIFAFSTDYNYPEHETSLLYHHKLFSLQVEFIWQFMSEQRSVAQEAPGWDCLR